ncbi:hypothetical protein QBC45DRAFT_480809 [Copromyces sp. CBS 386.78]|nr:hypothetical protein QBC45DRAFT_480809 [Copromyces sp. CBS 386.78]
MILLPRKKTSVEAGWIVFAVIFSTFTSALIIFLCWWTTRGSSKKSSSNTQQQQNASSSRQLRSRRSVRYWYYYPEYFGHNNGSSGSPSEDYASYTGTEYHLEQQQTPNYYIYPPPPYPPCPDPPPPPPQPPRTPPHIAVYRTRPVNVMSFLDRNQRKREPPPPPAADVTSPEGTSTPTREDGSSSSSSSSPDEPPLDGDGPPPHGPKGDPSGGPRPDGSAPGSPDSIIIDVHSPKPNGSVPGSPDAHIIDVHSPTSNGSVISRQDLSEAQANFGKLMSLCEGSNRCVVKRKAWVQSSIAKGVTLWYISHAKGQPIAPKVSRLPSLTTRLTPPTLQPASVSYTTPSLTHSTLPKPPQSSPAYGSGGYGVAVSPQREEQHERKGSRQSSTYSRHSGAKSPSAVSVSVVELLSLEKDLDQTGQRGGMSLLEHEEQEELDEREGDETVVLDEEGRPPSRRSVSRGSSHRQVELTEEREAVDHKHEHDHHDDLDPEHEPERVPEDYYRSYSHATTPAAATVTEPLPPSPNLSAHSSNFSPRSPYHPGKYIPVPIQVPKENRPHQASVYPDSGIGGVGDGKGG